MRTALLSSGQSTECIDISFYGMRVKADSYFLHHSPPLPYPSIRRIKGYRKNQIGIVLLIILDKTRRF